MKRAIIPGTFDPITQGHLDIVRRAASIFDDVIVAVAESPEKGPHGPLFSLDERVALARESLAGMEGVSNVSVAGFEGMLIDFAKKNGAHVMVKGLRAITDFEYEFQMAAMNYEVHPSIETMFIMSPPKYMYLSSSIVRELARLDGPFKQWVTPCVCKALCDKYELAYGEHYSE